MSLRERILTFGPEEALGGILTLPPEGDPRALVILPNAGIVHRVGPHRLNVRIARALARDGYGVLRFDLSGLGDSLPSRRNAPFPEIAVDDIAAAITAGSGALGELPVVLIGLCSGADNGLRAASRDERIGRLILLDPYAFETRAAQIAIAAEKMLDAGRWGRKARTLLGAKSAEAEIGETAVLDPAMAAVRYSPPRAVIAEEFSAFAARGGRGLVRYTDFASDTVTKPEHFYAAFPEVDLRAVFDVDIDRRADHTYSRSEDRQRLTQRLGDWLSGTGA